MPSTATKKKTAKPKEKKPRVDVDQVVTDRIIEALTNGVVPWRCKWARDASAVPRNATTGNEYRGINVLMLVLGGYTSPFWLTFNQAKAHGGAPRKGEHGMPCVRWVEWDRVLDPGEVAALQAQGKPVKRDKKGRPVLRTIGPRLFWVFNVEQCDGLEDLQLPEVAQVTRTDWDPIAGAEQYARGYDNGPTIREQGDRAFYRPSDDLVTYPERDRFPDPVDFYLTAFHELVHSTGHPDRLNRRDLAEAMTKNRASYSREELTAEVGAAMLCAHAGLKIPAEESASYIAGWLEALRGDHRLVITAAQHAQKGVDLIRGEQA